MIEEILETLKNIQKNLEEISFKEEKFWEETCHYLKCLNWETVKLTKDVKEINENIETIGGTYVDR